MKSNSRRWLAASVATLAIAGLVSANRAEAKEPAGEALLNAKCSACHPRSASGGLSRIDEQRKSPEGWSMTVRRMEQWHGLMLSETEERRLIKHLADTHGLAPEEAAPLRYALERRTLVETPDDADIATLCARCHSYARVGLQRRTATEWRKLAHMHLGQWPTVEYQAMSRDRKWWEIVSTELPPKLAAKWPLDTQAWKSWKGHRTADLSGSWTVAGHRPGKGDYSGRLEVGRTEADTYTLSYRLTWADGDSEAGSGGAVVYTGYEWRGSVTLGKEQISEVLQVSADGNRLHGRWYLDGQDAIGADMVAVRGKGAIAAVSPSYLKAGETARITISGSGLSGPVSLGNGIRIEKVVAETPQAITVMASAASDAAPGAHDVSVGKAKASAGLVVYDKLAAVKVEPETMLARVGGNGGPVEPAMAQFDAIGYMKAGDVEVRIGAMPAKWVLADFDKTAEEERDSHFGGTLRPDGLFIPAAAGPNPERHGNNNAANLLVKAEVADGPDVVGGSAHLIVAPQRWNDAPIR
jgi:quinohemoprotein amine dehydrogenase